MKLRIATIAAVAFAAVLAMTASASPVNQADRVNAARACKALRTSLGATTFAQTYGTSANAYGKCVAQMTKTLHAARHTATTACRAQNLKGRALRQCIASRLTTATNQQIRTTRNAAQECKAERESLGTAAFNQKYGTNTNDRNAFGKCVSGKASQGSANQTQNFRVTLTSVNNSGVTGTAVLRLKGDQLTVTINATGLTPNQVHVQHIHVGSSCSAAGATVLDLTPFPTADAQGRISYTQTFTIASSLLPLTDRTINLHGMVVDGTYNPGIIVACGAID